MIGCITSITKQKHFLVPRFLLNNSIPIRYLWSRHVKLYSTIVSGASASENPKRVVIFGNVLLDSTVHLDDLSFMEKHNLRMEEREEVDTKTLKNITAEACEMGTCKKNVGGASLNTGRILQHLGTDVFFLGSVGNDTLADHVRKLLTTRGLGYSLHIIDGSHTGECLCLVHGKNTAMYANIGASVYFSIDYLKSLKNDSEGDWRRPPKNKQILYFEGFFIPHRCKVCEYIVENYVEHRRRLAINLSATHIVEQNIKIVEYLAHKAYFVFGNADEFTTLAKCMGCKNYEEAAEKLMEDCKPKIIAITKGSHGSELITNLTDEHSVPGKIRIENYPVEPSENVLDTTGCGDAFVGGFLHAWLNKCQLSECVRLGTQMASLVSTQIGCNLPNEDI